MQGWSLSSKDSFVLVVSGNFAPENDLAENHNPSFLEHGHLVLMGALGETFYLLANQVTVTKTIMMLKALVTILMKIFHHQVFPAVWLSRGLLESAVEEADMKVSNKLSPSMSREKNKKHKSQPMAPNQLHHFLKILQLRVIHSINPLYLQ